MGHYPISIEPVQEKVNLKQRLSFLKVKKISHKDVTIFFRRLADTIKGGLPLARALSVLRNQTENSELKRVTNEILVTIQEGTSLSDAIDKYPAVFPKIYVGMLKAGESGGILDAVLNKIAQFNEKKKNCNTRLSRRSLTGSYERCGFCECVVPAGVSVIPKFEIMFEDINRRFHFLQGLLFS